MSIIRIKFVILLLATVEICATDFSSVMENLLPAYVIAKNADLLTKSKTCQQELELFKDGVDNGILWSLRMLDSSGYPRSGFLYGNNYWTGSENQCYDTENREPLALKPKVLENNTLYRKPDEEIAPYKLNYFDAHFLHNSTLQYHTRAPAEDLITLGLCLPASCTTDDLGVILEKIFEDRTLIFGKLYRMGFKLLYVKDSIDDYQYLKNWRMITVGFIVIFTLMMIVIATFYDICVHQGRLKVDKCFNTPLNNGTNNNQSEPDPRTPSKLALTLLCFSASANSKDIFGISKRKDSIRSLHGIRALGMIWIIVIHVMLFGKEYTDNKVWVFRSGMGFLMQTFSNGSVAADTFFFMSGFLLAYGFFKSQRQLNDSAKKIRWSNFFRGIVKRFIRITPAYMMAVGIAEIVLAWQEKTSSFYVYENPWKTCSKYWWRNLLYINNFFKRSEMCIYWSYYLSNDMQFFIVGSFLLFLSERYRKLSATLFSVIFFTTTIYSGYTVYDFDYSPTVDEQLNTMEKFYDPPWMRIGSYLIGLATGYFIVAINEELNIKRSTACLLWISGTLCDIVALFGLYFRNLSIIPTAIYVALHRTVWSIGFAWLVIACSTNNGGSYNKMLSLKVWLPFSKLSYCAYLVNPLVISFIRLHSETAFHLDWASGLVACFGFVLLTYFCAYFESLMFEMPYISLLNLHFEVTKSTVTNKRE